MIEIRVNARFDDALGDASHQGGRKKRICEQWEAQEVVMLMIGPLFMCLAAA